MVSAVTVPLCSFHYRTHLSAFLLNSMLLVWTKRQFQLTFRSKLRFSSINNVCKKKLSNSAFQAANMETVNTTERLRKLRDLMKENRVDVYSMIRE